MTNYKRIKACFGLLERQDRKKLILIGFLYLLLSLLDLIAIGLVGLLGALSVSGIQSRGTSPLIYRFLSWLNIEGLSFQGQVALLGAAAGLSLLLKTLASSYVSYRVSMFLAFRGASISSLLIEGFIRSGLQQVNRFTTQQTIYALTQGVNFITLGVIGACLLLLSEVTLLLILTITLVTLNPLLAIGTILYFTIIALLLYVVVQKRVDKLARDEATQSIRSQEMIAEARGFYKELVSKGREQFYVIELTKSRYFLSSIQAKLAFFPNIPKYFVEVSLVVGAILLAATTLVLYDAQKSVGTLSIFLLAAFRIAPAVLRMQSGFASIRQNLASSEITLNMYKEMGKIERISENLKGLSNFHSGFVGEIKISRLSFRYEEQGDFEVSVGELVIPQSTHIGITGSSGSGKSTLVNLILGILNPSTGSILISDLKPKEAIKVWPGAISYVPQEVFVSTGTLKENVCLGFDPDIIPDSEVIMVLELCELKVLLESYPNGINTRIGERGSNLSGGQKQRLGIARALLSKPQLLIMDESTSALDELTKESLLKNIFDSCPNITLLSITHDPAILKKCQKVLRVNKGEVTQH
jgi:ABC-type bacteriocin/lantibiotic exporter with double-glycine peptidase domain